MRHYEPEGPAHYRLSCRTLHAADDRQRPIDNLRSQYLGSRERESLKQTGDAIRAAFARGDVPGILAYHHPDVIKALSYQNYLKGSTLSGRTCTERSKPQLEFTENQIENTFFQGETAVEESLFAIKITPKTAALHDLQRPFHGGLRSLCPQPDRLGLDPRDRATCAITT